MPFPITVWALGKGQPGIFPEENKEKKTTTFPVICFSKFCDSAVFFYEINDFTILTSYPVFSSAIYYVGMRITYAVKIFNCLRLVLFLEIPTFSCLRECMENDHRGLAA